MATPLIAFLKNSKHLALDKSNPTPCTVVLGNPSCDLDSFISAVTLSYFYSSSAGQARHQPCIPLLNLPDIKSADLWRLRPEFGVALRLALDGRDVGQDVKSREKELLGNLTTIADLRDEGGGQPSRMRYAFGSSRERGLENDDGKKDGKQSVILVDHNTPSIPGLSLTEIRNRMDVVGCIDHHDDEGYVEKGADPRIIQTGIGSCTSLVVEHLNREKFWVAEAAKCEKSEYVAFARLALAPILIDTANLMASGDKNSPTDRDAVKFLEAQCGSEDWDRTAFYQALSTAKSTAIELLTVAEVFDRDYKEWQETTAASSTTGDGKVNIGISSLTAPLQWLIRKGDGYDNILDDIRNFIAKQDLSIFAILSVFEDAEGKVKKEDLVIASNERAVRALEVFQEKAIDELKLKEWHEDDELLRALDNRVGRSGGAYSVWWQCDVNMSRKQVAPLLRDAVKRS